MSANALMVHGGAPTAVINASLYGAICEAKLHPEIGKFYAASGGAGALLQEEFIDLFAVPGPELERLAHTPASAIGTSRDPLEEPEYERIAQILKKHDIRYVFFTGGNGTMDTCGKVCRVCRQAGLEVQVVGIPKTIDNDIALTDHAPGFGSAARYIAATVREVEQDIRALPIHVCILETMGRNAGWITAASALAGDETGGGPDLIYLPERAFDQDRFLSDVERLHKARGGVLVVASEGLKNKLGEPIVEPIFQVGRAVYYGDVGAHLANLVIRKLGIKARSEKPGICGRTSMALQSEVDREEAILAGREAVKAALAGSTGVMVGFEREPGAEYRIQTRLIPVEQVMLEERILPDSYINEAGNGVTPAFLEWCRPLLGGPLPPFARLRAQ